jgi:prepilin-type N-terminal cleavage/methylation domain-containing protein
MITNSEIPTVEAFDRKVMPNRDSAGSEGFTLVESLMAILILALGFMFVAPMLFDSIQSLMLARSKDTAGFAATNQLETLAGLYKANPNDANLTIGAHGPVQVEIVNPADSSKLNRYNVAWTVASVPDPRAGKVLRAVQVTATVTPIGSGTSTNIKVRQNKVLNVTTIFSYRSP